MLRRELLLLVLASAFGFVGGAVFSRVSPMKETNPDVVRASKFELVDRSGKSLAFWGVEPESRRIVMSFNSEQEHSVASFGISHMSPFLEFSGGDGKTRLVLKLGRNDRPYLAMGDERTEGRILLGFVQPDTDFGEPGDDWALRFRTVDVGELATFGMEKNPHNGKMSGGAAILSQGKSWIFP
jgi:hypothetical protein